MTTTRTRKTPRQRAEEALALAERQHERALSKVEAHDHARHALTDVLAAAAERRAYAQADPALNDTTLPTTDKDTP